MSNAGKLALVAGGIVAAVVLYLVLRPDDEETAAPTTPTVTETDPTVTETAPTTTVESTTTTTVTTTAPAGPEPVRISFVDGEVTGPRRPRFTVGDRIVLIVRADVEDEVHVHGYDLTDDVAPGNPARISFIADSEGRFEVELEDRHLPLTELVVEP
jgi:hypothetical protein